ncbi:MAG: preprotein translocase subunit SecE [Spongiibacteraceae bacterium]
MNTKVEAESGRFDSLKWLLVVLLVATGVVGNVYFAGQSLLYRVIALLVLAVLAAFVALQTVKGVEFWKLAKEAKIEIRKVVWPTRQEATQTTMIVFAFVLLTALILWGLDSLIGWLASRILGLS